jgi:hypothetical protein
MLSCCKLTELFIPLPNLDLSSKWPPAFPKNVFPGMGRDFPSMVWSEQDMVKIIFLLAQGIFLLLVDFKVQ